MKFIYGKNHFKTIKQSQENCCLLANGMGGYSSLTIAGSVSRNDHALLMASKKAPTERVSLLVRMEERVRIGDRDYNLGTQEYVDFTKNEEGFRYLNAFTFEDYPVWTYQTEGAEVKKQMVLKYGENTLAVRYRVVNRNREKAIFSCSPWLPEGAGALCQEAGVICGLPMKFGFVTDGEYQQTEVRLHKDLYFAYDARDGRPAVGSAVSDHKISIGIESQAEAVVNILYSTDQDRLKCENLSEHVDALFAQETCRRNAIAEQSGIQDETGLWLAKSADQFIVDRESTQGKTIIAGYPFFGDWGRDTMIAMLGCCISSGRKEDAKSIFRSFMKYCKNGIMPNMFPEDGKDPFYNTVDASLLFFQAVYEYYQSWPEEDFLKEVYPVLCDIVKWYSEGTDYHIRMDTDGLVQAGAQLEQLTWMDIRFGEILPTARHGKPVEINAYWYNALRILAEFSEILDKDREPYEELADKVKDSFAKKFWNPDTGCLKDVLTDDALSENQIRCNQIWAVSAPFSVLTPEQEQSVVNVVYEKLYTPYGLRTLSRDDPEYHGWYGGSQFDRDMAYHQGTVWPFPMGGYYLAYLKVHHFSPEARQTVNEQLAVLSSALAEGCVGQLPEVYDGEHPGESKGCFAQAWSVGEILRVYKALAEAEKGNLIWN